MPKEAGVLVIIPDFADLKGITDALNREGHRVVGAATNSYAAERHVQQLSKQGEVVDVVILGGPLRQVPFSVPEETLIERVRESFPNSRVIGLDTRGIKGVDANFDTHTRSRRELAILVTGQ